MSTSLKGNSSRRGVVQNWTVLIPFAFGAILGFCVRGINIEEVAPGALKGSVSRLGDIPASPTSHVDERGRHAITKQQLVEPFVVPNLAGISVATLLPDQTISSHKHETMHEFFYVLSGTGIVTVDEVDHGLAANSFVHVTPGELHSFQSSGSAKEPMKMVVVGVTTGPKRITRR
jgi:mannose-6-phosphate isomerase-like protein (cupin superfamily)